MISGKGIENQFIISVAEMPKIAAKFGCFSYITVKKTRRRAASSPSNILVTFLGLKINNKKISCFHCVFLFLVCHVVLGPCACQGVHVRITLCDCFLASRQVLW